MFIRTTSGAWRLKALSFFKWFDGISLFMSLFVVVFLLGLASAEIFKPKSVYVRSEHVIPVVQPVGTSDVYELRKRISSQLFPGDVLKDDYVVVQFDVRRDGSFGILHYLSHAKKEAQDRIVMHAVLSSTPFFCLSENPDKPSYVKVFFDHGLIIVESHQPLVPKKVSHGR